MNCTSCNQDRDEVMATFKSIKEYIPADRHYIFHDYSLKVRDICIECYIKTTIMFQVQS